MKTIVNTACADYFASGTNRHTTSNECKLYTLIRHCFVQGEVVCAKSFRRWQVDIVQTNNGKTAFSIGGYTSKGFCFEPDISFEYKLIFKSFVTFPPTQSFIYEAM